jgi:hypothetical protein
MFKKIFAVVLACFFIIGVNLGMAAQDATRENAGVRLVSSDLKSRFFSSPRERPEGLVEFKLVISVPLEFGSFLCQVDWGGKNVAIEPQRLAEGRYLLAMKGEPAPEVYVFLRCEGQSRTALIRVTPFSAKVAWN